MTAPAPALPRRDRATLHRLHRRVAAATTPRRLAVGAVFALLYVTLDAATQLLAHAMPAYAPWHPQAALATALIVAGGLVSAPALFIAVLVAAWSAPPHGLAATGLLIFCLGAAASYCAAGAVLARLTRWSAPDVGLRDVTIFVAVALAAGFAVAAAFSAAAYTDGSLDGEASLRRLRETAIGTTLGMMVAGPLLLQIAAGAWRQWPAAGTRRAAVRDLLLFTLAMAAVLVLVFAIRPFDEFRMFYLMFLPIIAVTVRHGLAGAAVVLPVVQLGLAATLALTATRATIAFEFQVLMLGIALATLYLGAAFTERDRAAARLSLRDRELREQREQLSEAQRIASTAELAAALAHDLNQPLSAIGTYARAGRLLLERGREDRDELVRILGQVASESQRAGQYVRRMREFFRSGAMRSERIDVRQMVDAAHAHLRDRLQREAIAWSAAIEPGLPPARGDAVQIGAVLDNLLANACDVLHGARGERAIRVSVFRADGGGRPLLRICVQDSGPGVPSELRAQLFKPLATTKPHGMGLGLALSRSIAERLEGRLWFDDAAARTTFCLDLPADE